MKLPAFFGHKRSINLLPRDAFESSTLGVILEWSLVFGKWAVIVTQLVVMGAFLYRFTLDRNLTDLRKSIAKNVAIVKSYEQVERDYVLAQKQVLRAKTALAAQEKMSQTLSVLGQITPSEIWYDRISITPEALSLNAFAATLPGFGKFLTAAQRSPSFEGIRLTKLESSSAKGAQIQFEVSLDLIADKSAPGAKK